MKQYRVMWEMTYQAETTEEAVRLAMTDLHQVVITHTEGPSFFEVMDCGTGDVEFVDAADAMFP
jgi:hypothetical protein